MASKKLCTKCHQSLPNREYLTCLQCINTYDLECANVPSKRFYNTMTSEHKKKWKCQSCCKISKIGNTDSPMRLRDREIAQQQAPQTGKSNIITKQTGIILNDTTSSSDDLSILGDTINPEKVESTLKTNYETELTLQNLSEIISLRLKENNKSIISELQNTIQIEINKAIKQIKEETCTLFEQNEQRKEDIGLINSEIEDMKRENEKLKMEIKQLERKITTTGINYTPESNKKKIVIYGLVEYNKEPEYHLYNRLVDIFRDICNVDLSGYIEETYRIGKFKNNTRPLVIELITKRMTRYLLENRDYFQGTGLSISDFLDQNARRDRQVMRDEMLAARKKGLHAVIRNNELYIEGKIIKKNEAYETSFPNINNHSSTPNRHEEREINSFRNN